MDSVFCLNMFLLGGGGGGGKRVNGFVVNFYIKIRLCVKCSYKSSRFDAPLPQITIISNVINQQSDLEKFIYLFIYSKYVFIYFSYLYHVSSPTTFAVWSILSFDFVKQLTWAICCYLVTDWLIIPQLSVTENKTAV